MPIPDDYQEFKPNPEDLEDDEVQDKTPKVLKSLNLESLLFKYRFVLLILLLGLILIGAGVFYFKAGGMIIGDKIEVLESATMSETQQKELVVEIAGAVEKPGVYKLPSDSRIDDLLMLGGGLSAIADRVWVEKTLNRAAKLIDGQKIFIPKKGSVNQQTLGVSANISTGGLNREVGDNAVNGGLVNINSATQKQLEDLPGIGPVYAQNIIEHRPYSSVEELLGKGVLKKNVYEKIKNLISVY